jgi:hypothetical protein
MKGNPMPDIDWPPPAPDPPEEPDEDWARLADWLAEHDDEPEAS